MKVKVIIPWRWKPDRVEQFAWVKKYYEHIFGQDSVHIEEDHCRGHFNLGRIINRAVERFPDCVIVKTDADIFVPSEPLLLAIKMVSEDSSALVRPHNSWRPMSQKQTMEFLAGHPPENPIENSLMETIKRGKTRTGNGHISGVWVAHQSFLSQNKVPEFDGHGSEDVAFFGGLLAEQKLRIPGPLYHLWHPRPTKKHHRKNKALAKKHVQQQKKIRSKKKFFITHCIPGRKKLNHRIPRLAAILRSLGHKVTISRDPLNGLDADEFIIFNGGLERQILAAEAARERGQNLSFMEVGYFPQRGNMMLGRNGTFGGNLFLGESVPQNTEEDEIYLDNFLERYSEGKYRDRGRQYILCMLQVEKDATIRKHSPYRKMWRLVDHVESQFPGHDIVFRKHPKSKRVPSKLGPNSVLSPPGRSLWEDIGGAEKVVGINSTALYEAVLAGKPVEAYGDCPLKDNPASHRDIVREILRRQIPNSGCDDFLERARRSVGRDWS